MARPLRALDENAGPAQAFAGELRRLHTAAGSPKFLAMARKTGKSRTALAEAIGGDHLPTWETIEAFVLACDGDTDVWLAKWEKVRDELRGPAAADAVAGESAPELPTVEAISLDDAAVVVEPAVDIAGERDAKEIPPPRRRTRWLPFAAIALVAALAGSAITAAVVTSLTRASPAPTPTVTQPDITTPVPSAVIMVQNKVALGSDQWVEDDSPAYLSSKRIPSCAKNDCKLPGTEMASGVLLVAICHADGIMMYNYNLDAPESKTNPNRAESALWYQVVLPDGRVGFLSEVYVAASDRGGKRLAICAA